MIVIPDDNHNNQHFLSLSLYERLCTHINCFLKKIYFQLHIKFWQITGNSHICWIINVLVHIFIELLHLFIHICYRPWNTHIHNITYMWQNHLLHTHHDSQCLKAPEALWSSRGADQGKWVPYVTQEIGSSYTNSSHAMNTCQAITLSIFTSSQHIHLQLLKWWKALEYVSAECSNLLFYQAPACT